MSVGSLLPKIKTMADFRPFKAWHYQTDRMKVQDVLAPPYDIISKKQQDELYQRSPYNCVRLILNRPEANDVSGDDRYGRAARFFREWREQGILTQDEEPCFYLYRQRFQDPLTGARSERMSILGTLKLEGFDKGIVVAHEKTLAAPKVDRRKLLEAAQANFSPIFGLFDDPGHAVGQFLNTVSDEKALFEATDVEGVEHVLWKFDRPERIRKIQGLLADKQVFIADGHHRYQTAFEYAQDRRRKQAATGEKELLSDFVLAGLVRFQDAGLKVFPTHRMILPFDGFDGMRALAGLQTFFDVEELPLQKLFAKLRQSEDNRSQDVISFGLVLRPEKAFFLELRDPEKAFQKMPAGKADLWYRLDVNVLNDLILRHLWNLSEKDRESFLRFTHEAEEAVRQVRERKVCASVLLRSVPVGTLRKMGAARELMPQKSTYFYPKLASGVVFYSHDPAL